MSEDPRYQNWWERTWAEREGILHAHFGRTHPPGGNEGDVLSCFGCGFGREKSLIPGACVQVYPPQMNRTHWVYVSTGVSQPDHKPKERVTSKTISGGGVEFAMLTADPAWWAPEFLSGWMAYTLQKPLLTGHYFAGGFYRLEDGAISWYVGRDSDIREIGKEVVGEIRGFLFMPMAGVPHWFTTETGKFELLVATGVTADELAYRAETSSAHLARLLLDAGVGQITSVDRKSVLKSTQERAQKLAGQSTETIIDGLKKDYRLLVN